MKHIALVLALLITLACLTGCRTQRTEAPSETAAPALTQVPTTEAPIPEVEQLPDFTVRTIDGSDFTLSEALKDHELVLINLFATWCPPCGNEFPYLQQAWEQASDRVAVIALSVEPTDTDEVLRQYAEEKGMTFPVGREEGTDLSRFVTEGIPTTVLVDRTGKVAGVEIGAKPSTDAFLELFDGFTGEDYDPYVCTYTVLIPDQYYQPVSGVTVNFCTDTACYPVTTDETGAAEFTGPPARYHVQIVTVPEGYRLQDDSELYTEAYAQTIWIYMTKEDA